MHLNCFVHMASANWYDHCLCILLKSNSLKFLHVLSVSKVILPHFGGLVSSVSVFSIISSNFRHVNGHERRAYRWYPPAGAFFKQSSALSFEHGALGLSEVGQVALAPLSHSVAALTVQAIASKTAKNKEKC